MTWADLPSNVAAEGAYAQIDPLLEGWAGRNQLLWEREDRNYSVRSCFFPLEGTESLQIWIDPPEQQNVVVHVALNSNSQRRRRSQEASFSLEELETGLDDALRIVRKWKNGAS